MNGPSLLIGFLLGFIFATFLAWRAQERARKKILASFERVKSEAFRILDSVRDLTEVKITIKDETGELDIDTDEPMKKPRKDLH